VSIDAVRVMEPPSGRWVSVKVMVTGTINGVFVIDLLEDRVRLDVLEFVGDALPTGLGDGAAGKTLMPKYVLPVIVTPAGLAVVT